MNCGICGEWAHFGCDRRQGLGAFKVLLDNIRSSCNKMVASLGLAGGFMFDPLISTSASVSFR